MTDPDDAPPRWRLLQRTDALVLGIAALFLAGYLTTVVLQVFVRYVLEYALPWTEEVGVYLFVWSWRMLATSSPVLQLPQGAVYAIVPLAGGYMALHLVVRLWELLTRAVTESSDAGRPC